MSKITFPYLVGCGKIPPVVTYYTTTSKDKDVKRSKKMNYFEYNDNVLPVRKMPEDPNFLVNMLFSDEGCQQAENLCFGWVCLKDEAPSDSKRYSFGSGISMEIPVKNKTFKNCAFACIDFSHLSFENCLFNNCFFMCCIFAGTSFDKSNVTECMFNNCAFIRTELYSCNFLYDVFRTCTINNWMIGPSTSFKDSIFDYGTWVESGLFEHLKDKPFVSNQLPKNVELYGWKGAKIKVGKRTLWGIVKLKIPKEAERVSPSGAPKCRCSKAKVIGIESLSGKIQYKNVVCTSWHDDSYQYKLGDVLVPKNFSIGDETIGEYDPNQFTACSNGIHFFLNREDAVRWVNDIKITEDRQETMKRMLKRARKQNK